jgi:broad specificity phosphatase PhoE
MDTPSYRLTLLRHAESEGNASGFWQGQKEYPLTSAGRAQAHALARRWKAENRVFDLGIASPQSRARETAEIITLELGVNLHTDPLWLERDNGTYAGTSRETRPPEPEFVNIYERVGGTGESSMELFLRGGAAIQSILHRPPGRYLIVAHGGILNFALYAALGIAPLANFRGPRFAFGNTGFAELEFLPHLNQWRVLAINDQAHLENPGGAQVWQP